MTNPSELALAALWKKLNFNTNTLADRIRLQKTVYLLSKLGYNELKAYEKTYQMYIYGPYSQKVARDAFMLSTQEIVDTPLSKEQTEILKRFCDLESSLPNKNEAPLYSNLELMANILYLLENNQSHDLKSIFAYLATKKSYFNDLVYFNKALDILQSSGLIHL